MEGETSSDETELTYAESDEEQMNIANSVSHDIIPPECKVPEFNKKKPPIHSTEKYGGRLLRRICPPEPVSDVVRELL